MSGKDKLSKTMRIDLIPDVPTEPVAGKKKRVIIATPTRKHRRIQARTAEEGEYSHYQELLQSVYDAALISDLTGKIIDANVRAIDFLLYDRNELCSLNVFDVISGANESLLQEIWKNLENERFTLIQAYCIRKDGSFFPSEIAVNKLRLKEMLLCFFIRDITIRRQQEEMLRTTYNAIQNSGNGIAVADLEAKLEYVNPSIVEMWGYNEPDELIERNVCDLLSDKNAANEMLRDVMGKNQTWMGEMRASKNGKGEFDVQVSAACNRNSDGEPIGMVFSFVDISDRKRAEEAIREAERHRVMLESLGAACHHMGQPATVLLANLGIMQKKLGDSDNTMNELVRDSTEAAESLGDILHKLNAVTEYKTTQYLKKPEGSDSEESRILEI